MKINKYFKLLLWSIGSFLIIVIVISAFKGPCFILIKYNYYNGYSKQKSNDYEGAITAYSKVLDYDKSFTTAYISRGSAYLDLKKYGEAIADYSEAIKQTPTNAQAYA
ncbi:MAG: tetratricopeptide repeat protein [Bacteroidota bacterium]